SVNAGNGGIEKQGCTVSVTPRRGESVDRVQAPPYHGEMKPGLYWAAGAILCSAGLSGCEGAGKKPVQARVPARTPAATATVQAPPELPSLPLTNPAGRPLVSLLPPVPGGKEYLIQKVQEKFASGEQNFKA